MNHPQKTEIDFIIVGQGLAGTLVAYSLLKKNKNILVIDDEREFTSSRICGGMFTPISGKRMVKSKDTDTLLSYAKKIYREMEQFLDAKLLNEKNIYAVFGSVKEQNDLSLKLDDANFLQHINLEPLPQENIKQPFGAFEIIGSGWVNIKLLLEKFKEKLISSNQYLKEKFDYALLKNENNKWSYKNFTARTVIFCEGAKATENTFFADLPFKFCKGDILYIKSEKLKTERIIKKGIGILHSHDDIFKIGSTYEWNDLSETPTESGKNMLLKKLDELIDVPYTVISHVAAIRPSTRTREPIIKQHPEFKNMFLLNGLGTKGVMNGPWTAKKLMEKLT